LRGFVTSKALNHQWSENLLKLELTKDVGREINASTKSQLNAVAVTQGREKYNRQIMGHKFLLFLITTFS